MREVFPVRSKRFARAMRVQAAQHFLAAVLLAVAAAGHLRSDEAHHGVLPYLELLTAVALIVTAIVQKARKTHAHGRFGWLELAGAAMMFVEAIAKLQERHRLSFHVLTFLAPLILLYFGLFDARIRAGLRMEANDDAFILQTRVFRRTRVAWADLKGYEITPTHIVFTRENGTARRVKTTDLENRDEAVAWAEQQFLKRGLPPVAK